MTEDVKDQQPDELELLRERAKQLGLKPHPKLGLVKLKKLVNDELNAESSKLKEDEDDTELPPSTRGKVSKPVDPQVAAMRATVFGVNDEHLSPKDKASRLVRVVVNCRNPNKQEWEGEIFTIGNRKFGFKKYVPFNNEEGWHIPQMMYDHLLTKQCQVFITKRDERGNRIREGKMINEFNIQVLPPLTPQEYKDLGQRQAMANGTYEG